VQANPDIHVSNNNKKNIYDIFIYIYKKKTYETTINAVLHKEKQILNYVLTTSKRISRSLKKNLQFQIQISKKKKKKKRDILFNKSIGITGTRFQVPNESRNLGI
jgi:hypothetical protein